MKRFNKKKNDTNDRRPLIPAEVQNKSDFNDLLISQEVSPPPLPPKPRNLAFRREVPPPPLPPKPINQSSSRLLEVKVPAPSEQKDDVFFTVKKMNNKT